MRIIALCGGSRDDREKFSRLFSAEALRYDRKFMVLSIDELVKNAIAGMATVVEGHYPDLRNRTKLDNMRMNTYVANPYLWAIQMGETINRYIFRGYNNFIVSDVWTPGELDYLVEKFGADYYSILNTGPMIDGEGPLLSTKEQPIDKLKWETFEDIYQGIVDVVDNYFEKQTLECEDKLAEPEELEEIEDENMPYHG